MAFGDWAKKYLPKEIVPGRAIENAIERENAEERRKDAEALRVVKEEKIPLIRSQLEKEGFNTEEIDSIISIAGDDPSTQYNSLNYTLRTAQGLPTDNIALPGDTSILVSRQTTKIQDALASRKAPQNAGSSGDSGSSQTEGFITEARPTTQQHAIKNPSAFAPGSSAQVKDEISSEAARILGLLPTPKYYDKDTYAGFTQDQLDSQRMTKAFADDLGAVNGPLEKQYGGIKSLLGQLDPELNPLLKQAKGNVGTFDEAYKTAADFADSTSGISDEWKKQDSRTALSGFTSRDVNPYLREMYQNQFNPMSRDVLDTGQQLVTDYNRRVMPQLEQAKGLASQATRQFLEGIAPELRTSSNQAGQYGSSKADIAKGLAATRVGEELARQTGQIGLAATLGAGELSDQVARKYGQFGDRSAEVLGGLVGTEFGNTQNRALQAAGQLAGQDYSSIVANEDANRQRAQMGMTGMGDAMSAYGGAYGQGQQGVTQGLGLMPSYYQSALMPSQLYGQVGEQNQRMNQLGIDQDVQEWNFTQLDAPWINLERAGGVVGVAPYQQQQQRVQSNPFLGGLAGGLGGMGAALAAAGTGPIGWGALLGAGLLGGGAGYFGSGGRV